jgi:carbon monoxide dehydrogenase subunit G
VRGKALRLAAELLRVKEKHLALGGGRVFVKDEPSRGFSLGELAQQANPLRGAVKPGTEPGLEATAYFGPSRGSTASGVHAMIVEVDRETAQVAIRRYVVVHDCGRQLNPMIVEGQIQGGVAHGIGNAFYEQLVFDEGGQLLNASLMDYLLPTALDVPKVEMAHIETPSPLNPTGAKGVGEAGAIPTGALFAQAVEDALHGTGVEILEIPLSPNRLFALMEEARAGGPSGVAAPAVPAGAKALAVEGSFDFDAPVEAVYEALLDPAVLASAMPGSQRLERLAPDTYHGVMKVGLGPVSAAEFALSVTVQDATAPSGYRMVIDSRGALGFVVGTASVRLAANGGGTAMRYRADLHVGGTLAAVGQRLLDSAGRVMSGQGLKALNRELTRRLAARPQ